MNIKIVSDGDPMGTQIIDADTGEPIDGLKCTRIVIDVKEPCVIATFTVYGTMLDVVVPDAVFERFSELVYDPDNTDSIERGIAALEKARAARLAS